MKKIMLSLGVTIAVLTPIVAVVSCGGKRSNKEETHFDETNNDSKPANNFRDYSISDLSDALEQTSGDKISECKELQATFVQDMSKEDVEKLIKDAVQKFGDQVENFAWSNLDSNEFLKSGSSVNFITERKGFFSVMFKDGDERQFRFTQSEIKKISPDIKSVEVHNDDVVINILDSTQLKNTEFKDGIEALESIKEAKRIEWSKFENYSYVEDNSEERLVNNSELSISVAHYLSSFNFKFVFVKPDFNVSAEQIASTMASSIHEVLKVNDDFKVVLKANCNFTKKDFEAQIKTIDTFSSAKDVKFSWDSQNNNSLNISNYDSLIISASDRSNLKISFTFDGGTEIGLTSEQIKAAFSSIVTSVTGDDDNFVINLLPFSMRRSEVEEALQKISALSSEKEVLVKNSQNYNFSTYTREQLVESGDKFIISALDRKKVNITFQVANPIPFNVTSEMLQSSLGNSGVVSAQGTDFIVTTSFNNALTSSAFQQKIRATSGIADAKELIVNWFPGTSHSIHEAKAIVSARGMRPFTISFVVSEIEEWNSYVLKQNWTQEFKHIALQAINWNNLSVKDGAFSGKHLPLGFKLPDCIKYIGTNAFKWVTFAEDFTLMNTKVQTIKAGAFYMTNLSPIFAVPKTATNVEWGAFATLGMDLPNGYKWDFDQMAVVKVTN